MKFSNKCPVCLQIITEKTPKLKCPDCGNNLEYVDRILQECEKCGAIWKFLSEPGWYQMKLGHIDIGKKL